MNTATLQNAAGPGRAAADDVLVSAEWLQAHLHDPGIRVIEVDVSRLAYDEWHIDGAVLWNIYADLKDAVYRLVDAAAVQRLLARSGIGPDSTVVCYGYGPGGVLRVRPGHGILADEAVRSRRRADPRLLPRRVAG